MSFDIDVRVRRGDRTVTAAFKTGGGVTALFGPSGVGKTTILHAVAGLLTPDTGRICVNARVMFGANINLAPHERRCGMVFQDGRLFPHMRVEANLRYGWKHSAERHHLLGFSETVDFLGIGHLLDRRPRTLSGGEAQRVAIGRALLSAPEFLAMDEPLVALDGARRNEIMTVIERIRDELRIPILYVSHDRSEVDRLATQIVELG